MALQEGCVTAAPGEQTQASQNVGSHRSCATESPQTARTSAGHARRQQQDGTAGQQQDGTAGQQRDGTAGLVDARACRQLEMAEPTLLFKRLRHTGDPATHDALVRRFLPLAHKLARRYARSSEPYEDLAQVASLGLLKAIERFDPERGISFSSFAIPTITGELKRYFRDCGWALHVPRGAQERALAIEQASRRLTDSHGQAPSVQAIAAYLHISCEQVLDGMQAARAYDTLSLDAPRGSGGEDDDLSTVGATIGGDDERYELVEADVSIAAAIHHLEPRERTILRLRFVEDKTQGEIAAEVGISQMQVSRLLRRSIEQLRVLAGERALPS